MINAANRALARLIRTLCSALALVAVAVVVMSMLST